MNCSVMPLRRCSEINYRVKCIAIESERIFGDVFVAQQTRPDTFARRSDSFPVAYGKKVPNLMLQTLEGPDFMELNRKPVYRKRAHSVAGTTEASMRTIGRSRSAVDNDDPGVGENSSLVRQRKTYPAPQLLQTTVNREVAVTSLVDKLLLDIYGLPGSDRGRSESDSTVSSSRPLLEHRHLQRTRLLLKSKTELRILVSTLREHVNHAGGLLIGQLRRREYLFAKCNKQNDVITAYLQARSEKRSEDTRMRFSVVPQPGESGFTQWLDAMKMVARLPGGIPPEFRKRLWLTLAERHLDQRKVDWRQAEKLCFNEWSNPDDEELGIQIVKDLHRTGCSLFCGAAGRDNQAVLRRVLLGFARWNKSVGYCQGLNVLAALVLQVMDRAESAAVKVMIYLIEGVLPEGYFADNLRGLSVDMAVFRDLLRMRLPKLSRHLEALQSDAKDKATGSSYEPPLTNVFTMQWFLTLFCHCLPQEAVLRVWDLIFLEGDEVLLRTALAIWEGLADRIMTVTSADEFYSIMGVLTREMLEFTDTNNLVKAIVTMGPLSGVTNLREKHRYNITPWARRLSDDEDTDTEEEERLAVAAAMFGMSQRMKKDTALSSLGLQTVAPTSDRERIALDIGTLKQQYAKLRERQRQAHIILSAACARQSMVPPPASQAMNHLLVGKSALVSAKSRQLGPPPTTVAPPKMRSVALHGVKPQNRKDKHGVTLQWKDTKRRREKSNEEPADEPEPIVAASCDAGVAVVLPTVAMPLSPVSPRRVNVNDSDSDSTSTELCDEPDRLSDVDSEEPTSTSDCYVMATDDERSSRADISPAFGNTPERSPSKGHERVESVRSAEEVPPDLEDTSITEIIDQIRRLSADDEVYDARGTRIIDKAAVDVARVTVPREIAIEDAYRDEPVELASSGMDGDLGARDKTATSLTLDTYDFLSLSGSVDETKVDVTTQDKVRSCDKYRLAGGSLVSDVTAAMDNTSEDLIKSGMSLREKLTSSNATVDAEIPRGVHTSDSSILSNHSRSVIVASNFDKQLDTDLDVKSTGTNENAQNFESFNSGSFLMTNRQGLSSSAIGTTSEESTPYPRAYVIGHLPISPITVDERLSKIAGVPSTTVALDEAKLTTEPENSMKNLPSPSPDYRHGETTCKSYSEKKQSPNTPESSKSFSSGETMGPDSKTSSLTASPRTPPTRSESKDFRLEKSGCSSVGSDSKTLTMHSADSDLVKDTRTKLEPKKASLEKSSPSTPLSTDSLKEKSDASPKLVVSSSSDSCSPDRKKTSEKSFSSDLQSPISASSIKFTTTCKGHDNLSESPIDLSSATSPFYPIAHPNRKTPSPYSAAKQKNSTDSTETSPEQKSTSSKDSVKLTRYKSKEDCSTILQAGDVKRISTKDDIYESKYPVKQLESDVASTSNAQLKSNEKESLPYESEYSKILRKRRKFPEEDPDQQDLYSEMDTVPSLPREKLTNERSILPSDRIRGFQVGSEAARERLYGAATNYPKVFERSSTSLDKRFPELKISPSSNDFEVSTAKKRSSDILEDLRHLEATGSNDGNTPETSMLTKKTGYVLEDLKNLEARRQDTFSDSARDFSKHRLSDLNVGLSGDARKTYVVQPKINIQEGSDSILKSLTRSKDSDELDDETESKVGVWTKVKPRKKGNSGRSSSDRALKIIQENSAILHKILTCQAKKRLPDLEEISKEITISPINEEISKIFSPILEKIGLNEHEINEELARINLKDFDQLSMTSGSEFDAKINDELSRLSLIDDSEEIDHAALDEILSRDYLHNREAFIDRQINEELSKLLANYEEGSPIIMGATREKGGGSSDRNTSELEGLDLSSISTNVFSHKSSNDSIELKSELESIQEFVAKPDKLYQYADSVLPYVPPKYNLRDISPRSDIDIYRELEKLDKISSGEMLPAPGKVSSKVLSPVTYAAESPGSYADSTSPVLDYSSRTVKPEKSSFDASPLKSPYDSYKPYDFKSRISPRKPPGNPYSARSYDKPSVVDSTFEFSDQKPAASSHIYDLASSARPALSKETLEFRVRYEDESARSMHQEDLSLTSFQTDLVDLSKGASYYEEKSIASSAKYVPQETRTLEARIVSPIDTYAYETSDLYRHRKYKPVSPMEYRYSEATERQASYQLSPSTHKPDFGSYLTARRRESHSLSPNHQFADRRFTCPPNPYVSKLSPNLEDATKRPVSHPEFPDKMSALKYSDLPSQDPHYSYRKSSLSLGNIGGSHAGKATGHGYADSSPSPGKSQFSPFPVRNTARKPKELGLKLGLYSPTNSAGGSLKRP